MKISVLSDLHLDFYINDDDVLKNGTHLKSELDKYLDPDPDVEVLIVAGDISHYNHQTKILEQIAEDYCYQRVFAVLGNHDLYLISSNQKKKYKNNSKNRMQDWYDYKDPKGIVHILDGEVIEYKGKKFGGAMSWYDGSYLREPSMYGSSEVQMWKETMNDARLIYGMGDFFDLFIMERPKMDKILDADVVITHINPLSQPMAFPEEYKYEKTSKFYCFDGAEYLKKTQAKFWVYGHTHAYFEYEVFGTNVFANPLGYPREHGETQNKVIEI